MLGHWGSRPPTQSPDISTLLQAEIIPNRSGILSDTKVVTANGWKTAADLARGELVLTFDAGLQPLSKVSRQFLGGSHMPCPKSCWPIEIPPWALGNETTMFLMPNQTIMLESDLAESKYNDPFALIPARALCGFNGIKAVPPYGTTEVIQLFFENDQVIFSKNGTLFFCPAEHDLLLSSFEEDDDQMYSVLPMEDAQEVVLSFFSERQTPHLGKMKNTSEMMLN